MELRQLRYFLALAETCHFGRAAEDLHIAQSALSQSIRQLESELGTTLLKRTTRQASLTPAGRLLQRDGQRILDDLKATTAAVRRVAAGQLGVLRLGVTGTAAVSHLPRIARAVSTELPGLSLDIKADLLTPAQCDGLRDGSLDIGVLRPPTIGGGIKTKTISVESLRLAVPQDHPLAHQCHITMADLRAESFIIYANRGSAVHQATIRSCELAGFAPETTHPAPDTPVVLSLVAAGMGVALVPAGATTAAVAGVAFRDADGAADVELALAWRAGESSPLVASVIDVLDRAGLFESSRKEATV